MSKGQLTSRRSFLHKVGATAGALALSPLATPTKAHANKTRFRWRLCSAFTKTSPILSEGLARFVKQVEQLSGGSLRIKAYGAGELVPAFGIFDAVKAAEIQAGYTPSYYQLGKLPASIFFASIPFGLDVDGFNSWIVSGGGQALWDEVLTEHGLQCVPGGNTNAQTAGWFNREIKSVADLKGLKMRIPGLPSKVLAKLGASPVLLSGGEVYTSLATGVIDACEWAGPYLDYQVGFQKIAKYYYTTGWHEPATCLAFMFNNTALQELPEELQLLLHTCASEVDRWITCEFTAKGAEYLEKIKAEGKVKVQALPAPVIQALKTTSQEVLQELIGNDPIARKVYDSYRSFQQQYENYARMTAV